VVIDTDCLKDLFKVNVEGSLEEVISSLVPSAKGLHIGPDGVSSGPSYAWEALSDPTDERFFL
jgi:hypothetical protein